MDKDLQQVIYQDKCGCIYRIESYKVIPEARHLSGQLNIGQYYTPGNRVYVTHNCGDKDYDLDTLLYPRDE